MLRAATSRVSRVIAALFVCSALSALPVASQEATVEKPTPPEESVLLRLAPVIGAQQEFLFETSCRLEMSARALGINLNKIDLASIAHVTQSAAEKRADGTFVMEMVAQVLKAVPPPKEGEVLGSAHNLITLDANRRLLEIADAPDQPPAEDPGYRDLIIQLMDGLSFPDEPVRIGDRWEATHEITMPETGKTTEMDVWGELRDRVLDGDRWVSVIYTELQIPLRLNHGDTEIRGNIGIRLDIEVYEDTGDIRYADGTGQGSAKPDLAVRVAKIRLKGFQMHLRQIMPDGRLLGSILVPEEERLVDPPEIEPAEEPAAGEPAADDEVTPAEPANDDAGRPATE